MLLRHTLNIALMDADDERRAALEHRLDAVAQKITAFAAVHELLVLLGKDQHFDILIAVAPDLIAWNNVVRLCKGATLAVLLLVPEQQWLALPTNPEVRNLDVIALSEWNGKELEWRIERLHNRMDLQTRHQSRQADLTWGDYRFIMNSQNTVFHKGRKLYLQPKEFEVALQLFGNLGELVPRNTLLNSFWSPGVAARTPRAVDVCVARIRKKLSLNFENGFVLRPIYGRGYQLLAVGANRAQPHSNVAKGEDG